MYIIAGGDASGGKQQGTFLFYNKGGSKKQASSSNYHRILICRDLSNDGQVMYLIEDCLQNKNYR